MHETYDITLESGKHWSPIVKIHETMGLDPRDYLNMSINEMDLSARARNCLTRAGITSVGELINYSPKELAIIRNLGVTSLNMILNKCDQVLSSSITGNSRYGKRKFGGHSDSTLSSLISTVSHVVSSMKTTVSAEMKETILEQLLYVLSDEDLWKNSNTSYSQALQLLIQSKTDFYFWNRDIPDKIKELELSTVAFAFYLATGTKLDTNKIVPDETIENMDLAKFTDYYDGENWRKLLRWICIPFEEVEKEIYYNQLNERERFVMYNSAQGLSFENIGRKLRISHQRVYQIAKRSVKKIIYGVQITGYIGFLYVFTGNDKITLEDACKASNSEVANVVWYSLRNNENYRDIPYERYEYSKHTDSIYVHHAQYETV